MCLVWMWAAHAFFCRSTSVNDQTASKAADSLCVSRVSLIYFVYVYPILPEICLERVVPSATRDHEYGLNKGHLGGGELGPK